jgi:hypothetical protein
MSPDALPGKGKEVSPHAAARGLVRTWQMVQGEFRCFIVVDYIVSSAALCLYWCSFLGVVQAILVFCLWNLKSNRCIFGEKKVTDLPLTVHSSIDTKEVSSWIKFVTVPVPVQDLLCIEKNRCKLLNQPENISLLEYKLKATLFQSSNHFFRTNSPCLFSRLKII